VNGLKVRIASSDGYPGLSERVFLLGMENVSDEPLTVPMAHPAAQPPKGLFSLQAREPSGEWRTIEGFGTREIHAWPGPGLSGMRNASGDPAAKPAQTATLAPGEESIVFLICPDHPVFNKIYQVKIVFRQPEPPVPGNYWHGEIETPVFSSGDETTPEPADGSLPFPAVFPEFDPEESPGLPNSAGDKSRFESLDNSNMPLMRLLRIYEPGGVRREFERRMAAEKDPSMKLLLATIALRAGSQSAADCLLDALRQTDYLTLRDVHAALYSIAYDHEENLPAWLVAMIEATLSDERNVTGLHKTRWASDTKFIVSHVADEQGYLARALGHAKCREAVPFLLDRVRKQPARNPIAALGMIGDARAVPVLIDIVKSSGREAKYEHGMLSPEIFDRAVGALADLKAADAVPVLLDYLMFPDVIGALERIGDRSALPALRELLLDQGRLIRDGKELFPDAVPDRLVNTKIALASLEEGDPVPRWYALLKDPSFDDLQRREIVWRLGTKPDPRAVPFLIDLIKTDPGGYESITVLAGFKYKTAVAGLIECFDVEFIDHDGWKGANVPEIFRDNIARSLREITGQKFGTDKRRWQDWWQNEGATAEELK
jgi:HEAT repeat protein